MLTNRSAVFAVVAVALLTGCPKKPTVDADAGAIVLNVDAGAVVADAAVADTTTTDAATPLTATTTTTATTAPHTCAAGQTAFIVDGVHACETRCNTSGKGNSNECTEPSICIGVAPLAGAEAGAAPAEYCRTAPSGACTGANMAQFWATGGRPTCEVLCKTPDDTSCPAGTTCKGNGQLYMVNGKMGEAHRYCRK